MQIMLKIIIIKVDKSSLIMFLLATLHQRQLFQKSQLLSKEENGFL